MPPESWSSERLVGARLRTDPDVAALVAEVRSTPGLGPQGYNRMLGVMDWYLAAPELLAVERSPLEREMRSVPRCFVDYYDPQPAPEWVDEGKLARASELWEENSLALLFILYVASLPACYLLHRGIPALYRSRKLSDRRYLPQRLYETGQMLDAVLDEDGLRLLSDEADRQEKLSACALRECGLEATWEWRDQTFVRRDGVPSVPDDPDLGRLMQARVLLAPRVCGARYVWGRGLISSRKVRFLHAFMREMLRHPPKGGPAETWNTAELGEPINQEDQAYTLLTFGYVMCCCLTGLGRTLSRADCEAFLHRWRLVGHLMGIEDGLMTDRWEEAEALFRTIREREAGPSEEGRALTSTLIEFLEELLPSRLGMNRLLPVQFVWNFIRSLGGEPADVLTPELQARRRRLPGRCMFLAVRVVLRLQYFVRDFVGGFVPGVSRLTKGMVHPMAEMLVESCWAAFDRRPFYVPSNLTQWVRDPGANAEFRRRLVAWRRRLFDAVLVTAALAVGGLVVLFLALAPAAVGRWEEAVLAVGAGLALLWGAGALSEWWVPGLYSKRPVPVVRQTSGGFRASGGGGSGAADEARSATT